MRKFPRRRECDDTLARDEVRGGDRHRAAEAVADQGDGFADAAQQRDQQLLDVPGDAQSRPGVRIAPIEQERPAAHPRESRRRAKSVRRGRGCAAD